MRKTPKQSVANPKIEWLEGLLRYRENKDPSDPSRQETLDKLKIPAAQDIRIFLALKRDERPWSDIAREFFARINKPGTGENWERNPAIRSARNAYYRVEDYLVYREERDDPKPYSAEKRRKLWQKARKRTEKGRKLERQRIMNGLLPRSVCVPSTAGARPSASGPRRDKR